MSEHHEPKNSAYGLLVEFDQPDKMVAAAQKVCEAGYTRTDCFSPYPVGGAADAMGFKKSEMGPVMFIGGLCGATAGFMMQYWLGGYDFPVNIAGRPFLSWPSFVPITFEMMVLTASLSGLFGLMALCGLPQPYHPLFNVPGFDRATCDRFFLCIEAIDPLYDATTTREFLASLQPLSLVEVPK